MLYISYFLINFFREISESYFHKFIGMWVQRIGKNRDKVPYVSWLIFLSLVSKIVYKIQIPIINTNANPAGGNCLLCKLLKQLTDGFFSFINHFSHQFTGGRETFLRVRTCFEHLLRCAVEFVFLMWTFSHHENKTFYIGKGHFNIETIEQNCVRAADRSWSSRYWLFQEGIILSWLFLNLLNGRKLLFRFWSLCFCER